MNVLLVEDRIPTATNLARELRKNKFYVDVVCEIEFVLEYARTDIYDIILLNIWISGTSSLIVLRQIRELHIHTPVILIAEQPCKSEQVHGLNIGADDCLTRPFSMDELLARITALNRRKGSFIHNHQLTYLDINLDLSSMALSGPGGTITLTAKECALLELLIIQREMISSKAKLIDKLWGYESGATGNNVEVYIHFLRKKLVMVGSVSMIRTIRGVGYRLEPRRVINTQ